MHTCTHTHTYKLSCNLFLKLSLLQSQTVIIQADISTSQTCLFVPILSPHASCSFSLHTPGMTGLLSHTGSPQAGCGWVTAWPGLHQLTFQWSSWSSYKISEQRISWMKKTRRQNFPKSIYLSFPFVSSLDIFYRLGPLSLEFKFSVSAQVHTSSVLTSLHWPLVCFLNLIFYSPLPCPLPLQSVWWCHPFYFRPINTILSTS